MGHCSLVHDCHRFKPPVRVLTDTTRMIGRPKDLRPRIVQEEKRIDSLVQLVAWKQIPHGETISDHMGRAWPIDSEHFFGNQRTGCHDALLAPHHS